MKNIFVIYGSLLLLFIGHNLWSQPTEIYGVVNDYTQVLEFDDCGGSVVVEDDMDLAADDRVLIIQMTGPFFYQGDDKNFGTVQHYSACGLFEFATVVSVAAAGSHYRVTFDHPTTYSYQAAPGALQLIKVPQYGDVLVTDGPSNNAPLTAQEWDGETGGVLVFESTGMVALDNDITVSEKGFPGGDFSPEGDDESLYGYIYPGAGGKSGLRGGGIGVTPADNAGRGTLVNGGGGGNASNAGGGGGGNGGAGGAGGNQTYDVDDGPKKIGGLGGRRLDYPLLTLQRIFMGGGGGGGHQDGTDLSNWATYAGAGGNGGGIVIIRAAAIDGNGYKIVANGENGHAGQQDGAGGGGAGGVILLSVSSFQDDSQSPDLILEAKGGSGGSVVSGCNGPGGGGGGGVIGLSLTAPPMAGVATLSVAKGNSGILSWCTLSSGMPTNNGAVEGVDGRKMFSVSLPGDPLP